MSNYKMIYFPDGDPNRERLTKLAKAADVSESEYVRSLIDAAYERLIALDANVFVVTGKENA